MGNQNQDFTRVLLFSIAADFFIISKLLGLIENNNKNFRCNQSMANIYKPMLESAGIKYSQWNEPFSNMAMFCSPSDDVAEMDKFFESVENLCMSLNVGARRRFNIPMPAIYKDGKDLDIGTCNEYLASISDFCKYIPASDNEVQMPTGNQGGVHEYTYFNLNGIA